MSDVVEYKFSELIEKTIDNRGKTCPTVNEGFPLIATNCVKNDKLYPEFINIRYVDETTYKNWFRGHPEPDDLIFVLKGTPGRVCWTPNPVNFCIAQDMVAIRANKKLVSPKYLFALLRSELVQQRIESLHVGSLIPHFKKSDFDKLYVPVLTDRHRQELAGNIYYDLCHKIELNNQINANLEALAQAIFKQWFIDFEFPDENGNPYKSSGGKMVESELGEIPKDWCLKSLYETACFMNGAAFKSEHFSADRGGLPIIKIVELKYGISPQTAYSVLEFDPKYRIDTGAVLYSWSGSPETSLEVFKWFGGAGWLNQHIFKVTTNNLAQEVFVYYLLRFLKPRLVAIAKDKQTTGLGHVTVADMKRLKVAYPCNKALLKFQQTVESIYYQHSSNELETKSLKELRDILLPRLISGKISID